MKKTFSLLFICLVLCCTLSCFSKGNTPTTESATTTEPPTDIATSADDFEYEIGADGGITIKKYKGDDEHVVIPEMICGKNVTVIGNMAFAHLKIVSVRIPDTVTTISAGAFRDCAALADIALPNALKQIGNEAFMNCTALRSVNIPKGLNEWSTFSFAYSGLESVSFEDGLEVIGESAFAQTNIKSLVLPSSVKYILEGAFYGAALESVALHDGLLTIADNAFGGDTPLTEIVIPASVTNVTERSFWGYAALEKVIFEGDAPTGYTALGNDGPFVHEKVFYTVCHRSDAKGFTSPFWCGYKTAVIGETPNSIPTYGDFEYAIENGAVTIHRYLGSDESVAVPAVIDNLPVTKIGISAFEYNRALVFVVLPDTVTEIGARAFWYCPKLTSVQLPSFLSVVGDCAFEYDNIPAIILPDGLTVIGERAFAFNGELVEIVIPASVKSISKNVFLHCDKLGSIRFEGNIPENWNENRGK